MVAALIPTGVPSCQNLGWVNCTVVGVKFGTDLSTASAVPLVGYYSAVPQYVAVYTDGYYGQGQYYGEKKSNIQANWNRFHFELPARPGLDKRLRQHALRPFWRASIVIKITVQQRGPKLGNR